MKKKNKKKKGALANAAVDAALSQVESLRINNPSHLDRIVFCFPRILSNDDEWVDGSPLMAAAVVIARDPEKQVNKEIPLRYYEAGHKIPSVIVPLNGIKDVEYHVSRRNLERLLGVGCVVFQPYRKGFGVRIPYGHPMLTGQPFKFKVK